MSDLEKAKQLLVSGGYTCALCKNGNIYTSKERGVKPLVEWLESDIDLHGFSAADKVVGKGAAFLYVLLGVYAVYANVISAPALELLHDRGILTEYGEKTDRVINRKGDGICPFEALVIDIDDAQSAYRAIREKMKQMNI